MAGPPRVVIADDDCEARARLREALRPLQADVREAADGVELLAVLSDEGPFDLVIADLGMPWPSGLQVAAMARTAGLATPFLLLAAFADTDLRARIEILERAFLLDKPVAGADLLAAAVRLAAGRS